MSVIPWSYSSLTGFETCPFQFYEVRIAKTTPRKEFAEAADGSQKHKAIELYLKGEQPLEDQAIKSLVDRTLLGLDPQYFHYEHQLSITKDQQPTEWKSENCYHRGVLDVLHVDPNSSTAHIFDWKFGKPREDSMQLKANAITVFAHFPHVETVRTEYVWAKYDRTTPGKVFRDFVEPLWNQFIARVDRMERAHENNNWPKCPSGLCKKYCPVVTCPHNGGFERG